MTAAILSLADAVVQELNGRPFSLSFVAKRAYRPQFTLAEMKSLHVTVVPKGLLINSLSRSSDSHEYQVDIAVQKKVDKEDAETLDPLMTLVEEIADHFRSPRIAAFAGAIGTKVENRPIYALEHLETLRQFTSVLTLTFRLPR